MAIYACSFLGSCISYNDMSYNDMWRSACVQLLGCSLSYKDMCLACDDLLHLLGMASMKTVK